MSSDLGFILKCIHVGHLFLEQDLLGM